MIARSLALVALACVLSVPTQTEAAAKSTKSARPKATIPMPRSKPIPLEIGRTPLSEHGSARRYRGAGSGNAESGLDGSLRGEIARLRALYGPGAVRVIGGAAHRNVAGTNMLSCHSGGHAFDGYLSAPAMAALRRSSFGIITYSGGHDHVHVSSCARERGLRAHNGGGVRTFSAGKRWKKKRYRTRR